MEGDWYLASVRLAGGDPAHVFGHCYETDPGLAIIGALERAAELGIDGVDLDMGSAYEHPWRVAG